MNRLNAQTIEDICKGIEATELSEADRLVAVEVVKVMRTAAPMVDALFGEPMPKARVVTVKAIGVSKLVPSDGNLRYLMARPHQTARLRYAEQVLRPDGMLVLVGHWDVEQHDVLENMRLDDELTQPGEPPPETVGRPVPSPSEAPAPATAEKRPTFPLTVP